MNRTIGFVVIIVIGFVLGYLIFGRISGEYIELKAILLYIFSWQSHLPPPAEHIFC
jgi:hypothetical protein